MNKNKSSYYLFQALQLTLIEIREEVYEIKNNRIYGLSNLLHNLPLQINCIVSGDEKIEKKCSVLLEQLQERSQKFGANNWMENVLNQ